MQRFIHRFPDAASRQRRPSFAGRSRTARLALLLMGAASAGATGAGFQLGGLHYPVEPARQLPLPAVLLEISGLTAGPEDGIWAHDDERGIVYRIDTDSGRLTGRFGLSGGVRADFEAIAAVDERLFLITSSGVLYETRFPVSGTVAPFLRHDEKLPCEVEGITTHPDGSGLLVACKHPPREVKGVVVYRWDFDTRAYAPSPAFILSRKALKKFLSDRGMDDVGKIKPTGMTTAGNGNLLLLAGRARVILELTPDGQPLAAARLNPDLHPQAEGIALSGDGHLLIADEGHGKGGRKGPGTLSVYPAENEADGIREPAGSEAPSPAGPDS